MSASRQRARRQRWLRIGFGVFATVVAVLLVRYARGIDWAAVKAALAGFDAGTLWLVAALALLSYVTYGSYDLAARRYAGHDLSTRRVLGIGMTAYAFALCVGAAIGSAGFRLRMYTRSGLRIGTISRVIGFSVASNWLGYGALAGLLFASGAVAPPAQWGIGGGWLRAAGIAMLLLVAAYLASCAAWHGRVLHVRNHHLRLPGPVLGALQVALAALNWSLMASMLFLLLGAAHPWPLVAGTLLLAAVASAIVHIPAGIGVMEAVFIAVLAAGAPDPRILAALLAWRALYYAGPLLLATVFYLVFEARGKRSA
ncbi:MAG: lysylphosphatidylglycerol synthase domain-containing protein [Pseudomonadota bacterium]|nr:lysylphosphatidylglycerol synthase domain-containing protein [Pseudomonadota bacterium]